MNGQVRPIIAIQSGEVQRWRIINASAARVYRLAIPGLTFLHVGTDGGLFERPVKVREIVVGNSERVEVLVCGSDRSPGPVAFSASVRSCWRSSIPQSRLKVRAVQGVDQDRQRADARACKRALTRLTRTGAHGSDRRETHGAKEPRPRRARS